MTASTYRKRLNKILLDLWFIDPHTLPYPKVVPKTAKALTQLMQEAVLELIGKDETSDKFREAGSPWFVARNGLRAEQRNRLKEVLDAI